MADKRICDICNINNAVRSFKIKVSKKGQYLKNPNLIYWEDSLWTPYKKIDICSECGNKILGLTKLMDNGMINFNDILNKKEKKKKKK